MTDNEIIKALECCANGDGCEDCPRSKICDGIEHMQNALDLINRQKAEIERLQKHNSVAAHKHYNDGMKDFAERLKETAVEAQLGDYYYKITTVQGIDYILKEMVSDNK